MEWASVFMDKEHLSENKRAEVSLEVLSSPNSRLTSHTVAVSVPTGGTHRPPSLPALLLLHPASGLHVLSSPLLIGVSCFFPAQNLFLFSSFPGSTCVTPCHCEARVLPQSCSRGICVFVVVFLLRNFLPWRGSGYPRSCEKTGPPEADCLGAVEHAHVLFPCDWHKVLWGGWYVLYCHFIDEETSSRQAAVAGRGGVVLESRAHALSQAGGTCASHPDERCFCFCVF